MPRTSVDILSGSVIIEPGSNPLPVVTTEASDTIDARLGPIAASQIALSTGTIAVAGQATAPAIGGVIVTTPIAVPAGWYRVVCNTGKILAPAAADDGLNANARLGGQTPVYVTSALTMLGTISQTIYDRVNFGGALACTVLAVAAGGAGNIYVASLQLTRIA